MGKKIILDKMTLDIATSIFCKIAQNEIKYGKSTKLKELTDIKCLIPEATTEDIYEILTKTKIDMCLMVRHLVGAKIEEYEYFLNPAISGNHHFHDKQRNEE